MKDADEDVLVDLRAEVANEDGVLWAAVVTAAVGETTTRGPVQLEGTVGVGDEGAVERKCLGGSVRAFKIDETVSSITSSAAVSLQFFRVLE